MEIDSLSDLFNPSCVDPNGDLRGKHIVFPRDYHAVPIPICQHNLYQYSPFHVELKTYESGAFLITFPASKLELIQDLDIDVGVPTPAPAHLRYPPRTEEECGSEMLQFTFRSTAGFGIEQLLAQIYLTYVNSFNFERWYPLICDVLVDLKPVIAPATLVALTDEEVHCIERLHETTCQGRYLGQALPEIRLLADAIAPRLATGMVNGFQPFFFKLNSCSAKDSTFYQHQHILNSLVATNTIHAPSTPTSPATHSNAFHRAGVPKRTALQRCQAYTAVDIVMALAGSSRCYADCRAHREWKVRPDRKPAMYLVIKPWDDAIASAGMGCAANMLEFRCFVFEGKMTALNQLCWETYLPDLETNEELQQKVVNAAVRLQQAVHVRLPWQHYILDIAYDQMSDHAVVVEFNPWGPYSCTGSQLFSWELDSEVLFWRERMPLAHSVSRGDGQSARPELRVLRPWLRVVDHFDLYVANAAWRPSAALLARLEGITKRCPCCKRMQKPHLPRKPTTQLCHLSIPIVKSE